MSCRQSERDVHPHDPVPFSVTTTSGPDGSTIVCVRGELDLATAPRLTMAVGGIQSARDRLIYDLEGLTFMDVVGLHSLVEAIPGSAPGSITIRNPTRPVRRLLQLVGMDDLIRDS